MPAQTKKQSTSTKSKKKKPRAKKVSRNVRPDDMSLEAWQRALRQQYGADQDFELTNAGDDPFFSEFNVTNPQSKSTYLVVIRGEEPGDNRCSCADFMTNTLGTCKHIEFTLAKLRRRRGAKTAFKTGFEPTYSEVYLHYGAAREVRFRPGKECPTALARLAGEYFDDEGRLREDAFGRFETFLSKSADLDHDLWCFEDVLRFIAEVRDKEQRRVRLAEKFPAGVRSAEFNNLLNATLYQYQREGALFAARAGRCLIADEMGLGKTIQAIAAAEIMARNFGVERVLVVCPTSLKHQWEREIQRFTERTAQVISGLRPKRFEQYSEESFFKITNYDTVHRDLEAIDDWAPDLVILDEAQRIKNWETRAARSVKKIESPYCVVLTGTPLENRLEELISIVQFVDQQRLGPTFRLLHEHQDREGGGAGRVVGYQNLDNIGKTLEPILLRRRKQEVLTELPERLEKQFFVAMTPEQRVLHEENREVVGRIVQKWRRYHFLSEQDKRRLMMCLQNMRMSCNSTYLLDKKTDFGAKTDEVAQLLDEMLEDPGTKVVIFSQWLGTHELIRRRLESRPWDHVFFHGGVPSGQRKGLVDRFREDPNCRVFLSTDAGGVGLNLQHANVVVNMDQPWNPAVLEQRIGRVHRMGQSQPVRVVNFIASGTIEEGMLGVIGFKQGLFAGVLDGGQSDVFLGESRLGKFMETVEKVSDGIPTGKNGEAVEDDVAESDTAEDDGFESATAEDDAAERPERAEHREDADTAAPAAAPRLATAARAMAPGGADPLAGLLQNGLALLQQLVGGADDTPAEGPARPGARMTRDKQTGRRQLTINLPDDDIVDQALSGLKTLLERLRG